MGAEPTSVTQIAKSSASPDGAGIPAIGEGGVASAKRAHVPAVAERSRWVARPRAECAQSCAVAARAERRADSGSHKVSLPEAVADVWLLAGESAALDGKRTWRHAWMLDGALGRRFVVLGFGDRAAGNDSSDAEQTDDEQSSRIPPSGVHGVFLEVT
ncbi:MAG TPA: hypothetical protein VIJ04_09715 [Xanthobacteraceae bacterium]